MKLGTKIILLVILTVTSLMTVHGYLSVRQDQMNALRGTRTGMHGLTQAVSAALSDLYAENRNVAATQAFAKAVAPRGNIHGLIVYDTAAQPVAISSSLRYPNDFPELNPAPILEIDPRPVLRTQKGSEGYLRRYNTLIYYRIEPIYSTAGNLVGAFVLARHGASLLNSIIDRRNRIIATTTALVLALSLMVWIIVQRSVARPIDGLIRRIREIGLGHWQQRIDIRGDDEVAALAREFNSMSEELQNSYDRLLAEQAEKLRLEQELRRSERLASVGQLAAGMAHEIGTPLNIISGRAEHLMRRQRSSEEMLGNLQTIRSQSERIAAIVRQLLDFSRRREPLFREVDIALLLDNIQNLLEHQLASKRIQVQIDHPPVLPRLRADAELLQQAFLNLFANSIYALAPGGSIDIRIEPLVGAGGASPAVRVYFEDNGTGIPRENLNRVFDPFFTTKDIGEGSGLGLSVVFGIVKDHGGEIRVESEFGRFCRFVIDLPGPAEQSASRPAMDAL